MERNLPPGHAGLRLVAASGLLILALDLYAISGETTWWWAGLGVASMAGLLLVSGLGQYCPIYEALGMGGNKQAT